SELFAAHDAHSQLDHWNPRDLAQERHCPGRARVDFDDMGNALVHHKLQIAQPTNVERLCNRDGVVHDLSTDRVAKADRRICCHGVATVDARTFDMFHKPWNDNGFAVANSVNVDLGPNEVLVDEHGP